MIGNNLNISQILKQKKPEDWDDEMDGEWEPPMIDNPAYKGEWKPKQIKNPNYKGKWVHPEIDNPEYAPDDDLYLIKDLGAIGFDLWQVKSGTIFDNILITDSVDEAKSHASETFEALRDAEKAKKEEHDEKERKKLEEEEKKRKEEEETKKDDDEAEEEEKEEDKEDHDEL